MSDKNTPEDQLVDRICHLVAEQRWWHVAPLLSDPDSERLAAFRQAWERLSSEERRQLVNALLEMAEEDPLYDFRAIFRWLLADAQPEVRATAIHGLWEDESPALIRPLLHMLQHDPDVNVREAAAIALGRYVLAGELGDLPMREVTPVVEALLQVVQNSEEDIDVRRRALESIAFIDEPHVRDLIEAAYYHPDTRMQVSAVFAMGRSGNTRWASYVLTELESPDPELRYEAALAAGNLELADAIQPLRRLIEEDKDVEIQLAAIEALGRIGGAEAERILLQLLDSPEDAIAEAAEDALDELRFWSGDPETLLFPLLDFEDLADEERFLLDDDVDLFEENGQEDREP